VEMLQDLSKHFVITIAYTVMGLIAFGMAFAVIVKVTPFSIRKELEEDHNVAFAVVIGAIILGIAHIVASTVQG